MATNAQDFPLFTGIYTKNIPVAYFWHAIKAISLNALIQYTKSVIQKTFAKTKNLQDYVWLGQYKVSLWWPHLDTAGNNCLQPMMKKGRYLARYFCESGLYFKATISTIHCQQYYQIIADIFKRNHCIKVFPTILTRGTFAHKETDLRHYHMWCLYYSQTSFQLISP